MPSSPTANGQRVAGSGDVTGPELELDAVLAVPRLLSVSAAARVLGCSPQTVRRRIRAGELTAVREHGRLKVRGDDLRGYIETLERVGGSAPRRRSTERRFDFLHDDRKVGDAAGPPVGWRERTP